MNMKIRPALCQQHEPKQRHLAGRLKENLPIKNNKKRTKQNKTQISKALK
jgi:hypothetical protein